MLLTVKDACELHPMALEYSMSEQIENLSDVISAASSSAREFFDKNYVTKGMETLLSQGLQRLGGRSDQAVFELKQAMGGGKTHSMIALGLLARDSTLRAEVVPEIAAASAFGNAHIVAVNGRIGFEETFVWGEIAKQLGKSAEFSKFWRDGAKAPSETDWISLIGEEPTLILLDELPPYFDYAVTALSVTATSRRSRLTLYRIYSPPSLKLKRCCIVISNLSGSYEGATRQLRQAIRNFEQEANRQARSITPVELASQEIYEILRKRLFRKLPDKSVIDSVASAYAAALSEASRSKSVAKSAEQIAEDIHGSYPFHPSVKHVVALFKENESYRQTRGLMQFVSKMLKSAWKRPNCPPRRLPAPRPEPDGRPRRGQPDRQSPGSHRPRHRRGWDRCRRTVSTPTTTATPRANAPPSCSPARFPNLSMPSKASPSRRCSNTSSRRTGRPSSSRTLLKP